MKQKLCLTILFLVLFTLVASSLFAQTRDFAVGNIVVSILDRDDGVLWTTGSPAVKPVVLDGYKVRVSVTDVDHGNPTTAFGSDPDDVRVDFRRFFEVDDIPTPTEDWVTMTQTVGDPAVWEATYTVPTGVLHHTTNANYSHVRVRAVLADDSFTDLWDDEFFSVNNFNADISAITPIAEVYSNPGPGGAAVAGSVVRVVVPKNAIDALVAVNGAINHLWMDFSEFGGSNRQEIQLTDVVNILATDYYFATYTLPAGTVSSPGADVQLVAEYANENEESFSDDSNDLVLNTYTPDLSVVPVITEIISDPSDSNPNLAIIGTQIRTRVSKALVDLYVGTYGAIDNLWMDFSEFGGSAAQAMLLTDVVNLAGTDYYYANYTLVGGTVNVAARAHLVVKYNTPLVNSRTTAIQSTQILTNNLYPNTTSVANNLAVNGNPSVTVMRVGDTIHVRATFDNTVENSSGRYPVEAEIDWEAAFPNEDFTTPTAPNFGRQTEWFPITVDPLAPLTRILSATFTPSEDALDFSGNLTVTIVDVESNVGNFASANPLWVPIAITGNGSGIPITTDFVIPVIAGAIDLSYPDDTILRFSPNSPVVDGLPTPPNSFPIVLTVPNWGDPGEAYRVTLRFVDVNSTPNRNEYPYASFFERTFSIGDLGVSAVGDVVTILWDGRDASNQLVPSVDDENNPITYGITLAGISDEVGNEAELEYIQGNEYDDDPANPYTLADSDADGILESIVNRVQVVVDNNPLTITNDLRTEISTVAGTDSGNPIVIKRYIDVDEDPDQPYYSENDIDLSFRVKRDYLENHFENRKEAASYQIIIDPAGADPAVELSAGNFTFAAQNDLLSDTVTYTWNYAGYTLPANQLPPAADTEPNIYDYPAGNYTVYAYFRDNAGNITRSRNLYFTIEDIEYALPQITSITVIERENPVAPDGLPSVSGLDPVFYLNAGEDKNGANFDDNYYKTSDVIIADVVVTNEENLEKIVIDISKLVNTPNTTIEIPVANFTYDGGTRARVTLVNVNDLVHATNYPNYYTTEPGNWTIGNDSQDIIVSVYPNQDNIWEGEDDFVYSSAPTETFVLATPTPSNWTTISTAGANLTITDDNPATINDHFLSPGNPFATYHAIENPARDGVKEEVTFRFNGTNLSYSVAYDLALTRLSDDQDVRTWTGTIPALDSAVRDFAFIGLKENNDLVVSPTGSDSFELELTFTPNRTGGFLDPGYQFPAADPVSLPFYIDNTNPTLVNSTTGTAVTVVGVVDPVEIPKDPSAKFIKLAGIDYIPVFTETENTFIFTLETSEYMPEAGWDITVLNQAGAVLNGLNLAPVTATFTVTGSEPNPDGDGYKVFNFNVTFNNLTGDFNANNALLHITLPNDYASNPGRTNDPAYSLNPGQLDAYRNDSAEYFMRVHFLNARPVTGLIEYHHKNSTGHYNQELVDDIQGWISDNGTISFSAIVNGGADRANHTDWVADLSAIMGAGNEAVAPTTYSAINLPQAINENVQWSLQWNNIPIAPAVSATWTNRQVLPISIYLTTTEEAPMPSSGRYSDQELHQNEILFNLMADINDPVVVTINNTTYLDVTTTPQAIAFGVTDGDPLVDSGVNWLATNFVTVPASVKDDYYAGLASAPDSEYEIRFNIPEDTDLQHFQIIFTTEDNVGNQTVYNRFVNIRPIPTITNVTINGGNNYFGPEEDILVEWDMTNPQRANNVTLTLTVADFPGYTYTRTINTVTANMSATVTPAQLNLNPTDYAALDGNLITATITGTYSAYTDATLITSLNNTMPLVSANDTIILDTVDPVLSLDALDTYITAGGTPNVLRYTATDASSGINWDTAVLSGLPGTFSITGSSVSGNVITYTITAPANTTVKYFSPTFTVEDNVENSVSITNYVNVRPIPVISTVSLEAGNTHYVPGTPVDVTWNLADYQRAESITVALTVGATNIASKTFVRPTDDASFAASMSHSFTGLDLTAYEGQTLTATISGYTDGYIGGNTVNTIGQIALLNSTDDILIDIKPIIQAITFIYNDTVINALTPEMNNIDIEIAIRTVNPLNETLISLMNDEIGFAATNPTFVSQQPEVPALGEQVTRFYRWSNRSINVDPSFFVDGEDVDLYKAANFTANAQTIYGYAATPYNHGMVITNYPDFVHYSKIREERFERTIDGWFAPEHELFTEVDFHSLINATSLETTPITAYFDRITDNVPEVWIRPNSAPYSKTPITTTLTRGTGTLNVTHYLYHASWRVTPDQQSVWSAYEDGESIPVQYKYFVFSGDLSEVETTTSSSVRVDLEVPVYDENMYWVALDEDDLLLTDVVDYQAIASNPNSSFRTINLKLDPPAPGTFPVDMAVYLKVKAFDSASIFENTGSGVNNIALPTLPAGWTVDPTFVKTTVMPNGDFYQEWRFLAPTGINDQSTLLVQLGEIEDNVGHMNYNDATHPYSTLYSAVAPTITFGFTAGDNDGTVDYIRAYQYVNAQRLDDMTTPYVQPGENLGLVLKLKQNEERGAAVASIVPQIVHINTPRATDVADNSWITLAKVNPGDNYTWYLDANVPINPADDVETMGLQYRVTYLITYEDATTETQTYTSNFIDGLIVIDREAPVFTTNTIVAKSTAYPSVSDNYVIPGFPMTLNIEFTDVHDYYYTGLENELGEPIPDTKPIVRIYNMNNFIEVTPDNVLMPGTRPYGFDQLNGFFVVNPDEITYNASSNRWVANVTGLEVDFEPGITSQVITAEIIDAVGNDAEATRFIEIADNGPIVPLMIAGELVTQTTSNRDLQPADFDYALNHLVKVPDGQTLSQKFNVLIYTEHDEYIDQISVAPVNGLNIALDGIAHVSEFDGYFDFTSGSAFYLSHLGGEFPGMFTNSREIPPFWIATFDVTTTADFNYAIGDVVPLSVTTTRHPYGQQIFTQTETVNVTVDGFDFNVQNVQVWGEGYSEISNTINPDYAMSVSLEAHELEELIGNDEDQNIYLPNTDILRGWFTLTSPLITDPITTATLVEMENVLDEDEIVIDTFANVYWTIPASLINDTELTQSNLTITYQNIYGITKSITKNFYIDQVAPVITANGIVFTVGTETQSFNYTPANDPISISSDWTKFRVNLNDPEIEAGIAGSGLYQASLQLRPYPETYQDTALMSSLNTLVVNKTFDGTNGNYIEFDLGTYSYSAYDLAIGYYSIIVNVNDQFNNAVEYVKPFYFNPANTSITLTPFTAGGFNINTSNAQEILHALLNDPTGTVTGVDFRLYYDHNNNGEFDPGDPNDTDVPNDPEYTAEDITTNWDNSAYNDADPNNNPDPDMVPPYEALWNFNNVTFHNRNRYNWTPDANYDTETAGVWTVGATRQFLLRVTGISNNRYITDRFEVINVTDDVAPVPSEVYATTDGAIVYDYNNPSVNEIELSARFVNWSDAHQVRFEIERLDNREMLNPIVVTRPYPAPIPALWVPETVWNYDTAGVGEYVVRAVGIDWVGNESDPVELDYHIYIVNPATTVTYNIVKHDVIAYNNQPIITDPDFGGNVRPTSEITNLRLNGVINSLNGIERFRFRVEKINNVTGETTVETVMNNDAHHIDYVIDANGYINAAQYHNISANIPVYIFVQPSVYETAVDNDMTYRFFIDLDPINPVINDDLFIAYTDLNVDNRAPHVTVASYPTQTISWAETGDFTVSGAVEDYDLNDVDDISIQWRKSSTDAWVNAGFASMNGPTLSAPYYLFNNWDIDGGSLTTFLGPNYEGPVQIQVVAVDAFGNLYDSAEVTVNVDNKAPETVFSHVQHAISYPTLTPVPVDNTIEISTSSTVGGNGSSILNLYVDAASIDADAVLPVMVYHRTPDTTWQPVMFDHEAWNLGVQTNPNVYEFNIPINMLTAGTHQFAAVMIDTLGNLEGDFGGAVYNTLGDLIGYQAYNGILNNTGIIGDEKLLAADLTVNVVSIDDVIASIEFPADHAYISGLKALTAIVEEDPTAKTESIRFERKVNGTWQEIATVASDTEHPVNFQLRRSDVPQYDNLPWVPGVHLFVNNAEVTELTWDNETQTWNAEDVMLTVGMNTFSYGIDLNNNGIIDASEYAGRINDPKGFVQLVVRPWTLALNSYDFAQGLHELRAVPLDDAGLPLVYRQSPSSWILVDNVVPVVNNITAVGHIQQVVPTTVVPFVTDINELLVAADDMVTVEYQYTGQPTSVVNRKWTVVGTSANMPGNYLVNWTAPNPLIDRVDNDGDGLVDEADEADANYYIRSIAHDRAGNYVMSSEYAVFVDGSYAQMVINTINGANIAATNNIFNIPAGMERVTLSAIDMTNDIFSPAQSAIFQYRYRTAHDANWTPNWTNFATNVVVTDGVALAAIEPIEEGYYQFRVYASDLLGNEDPAPAEISIIFNDVTGPEIEFVSVGDVNVVSEQYAFANDTELFEGNLTAQLFNSDDVNTVTFEYSENGTSNWINIATTSTIPTNGLVTVAWDYPNLRVPFLYVRAIAQDAQANNMSTDIVKLYHDTTAPSVELISFTHGVVAENNRKYIDNEENAIAVISFNNLVDGVINDVASITARIANLTNNTVITRTYSNVNEAATEFVFTTAMLNTLPDAIYGLEFIVTDFAGNSRTVRPTEYQSLYLDNAAPVLSNFRAVNADGNTITTAIYNEVINYRVNYTDLIGVPSVDGLTATFTYGEITQTVTNYTLFPTYIQFAWDPSEEFEQLFIEGYNNISVTNSVVVNDQLGHAATINGANFTLTYGTPANTRIMLVTDRVLGAERRNYVNWNLNTPQIVEQMGTNRTQGQTPTPLKIYAYVPHLTEVPVSVTFQYRLQGATEWTTIGTETSGQAYGFVDNSFLAAYQRQYSRDWNIVNLAQGAYEIRTVSNYATGTSESQVLVNLYNDMIIPQVTVTPVDGASFTEGDVERGSTYTLGFDEIIGNEDYLNQVVYKYRYVTVNSGTVTPTSQWLYFGNATGVEQTSWINAPFNYNWQVHEYYLFNNSVQIVAFTKDKWGTEIQINPLISNNAYAIANIKDTTAPVVETIFEWNNLENPTWVSGAVDNQIFLESTITSNVNPYDFTDVKFYVNNELLDTITFNSSNANSFNAIVGAEFTISDSANVNAVNVRVEATDHHGNVGVDEFVINIDNVLPQANLVLTTAGEPVVAFETGLPVLTDANPVDTQSGVDTVIYSYRAISGNNVITNWTNLPAVHADPFTYDWTLPTIVYGATYQVRATVYDVVGNVYTTEPIDYLTNVVINTVDNHVPVNGIIPVRLHGNFNVVTNVSNAQVSQLGYVARRAGNETWTSVNIVSYASNHTATLNMNDFGSGVYTLGVVSLENPTMIYDFVQVTIDNDLNITVANSTPATNGAFDGTEFVVNFQVQADADGHTDFIEASNVALVYEFVTPYDGTWYNAGVAESVTSVDGVNWTAIFTDVEMMHNGQLNNGIYNYAIRISDNALPVANVEDFAVAQNVIYDTIDPNIMITSINGITSFDMPVNVNLGSDAVITVDAHDILTGQLVEVASGINKVEFYYNFNGTDMFIAEDTTAPYQINWNTLGYQTGAYTVTAVAYDNAGNMDNYNVSVNIVSPVALEPYALITAMNFNAAHSNEDHIYVNTYEWDQNNVDIDAVTFEYFNGTVWTPFAQADMMSQYWMATFNAELMTGVQKIRPVVTYNNGLTSAVHPELDVVFSPENGGSLITNPVSENTLFYNNKLNVMNVTSTPVVTTMFNDTYVNMPAVNMVNGNYEAAYNVNQHGTYTFWSSALDNNGNVQLAKAVLNTYTMGTVADNNNVISVTIPDNSNYFVYFQNVKYQPAMLEGFNQLSTQKAVTAVSPRDLTYTITLNQTPATEGTIVGMYHNGSNWMMVENAQYNAENNTVTFTAPSGYIYAAAQYVGVEINGMFVETTPQYVNPQNVVWTREDTQLKFFVYDGVTPGGYMTPELSEINYALYLDDIQVLMNADDNYNQGFITYNASDLAAGEHVARLLVEKNGFNDIVEKTFFVDVTAPTIAAQGAQLTVDNRNIVATLADAQTGIRAFSLTLVNEPANRNVLHIPAENITIDGNVYTYELTYENLHQLEMEYTGRPISNLIAVWTAENNLSMGESLDVYYTVNISTPVITFTGSESGFWINPTHPNQMTFDVVVPEGRSIPMDGVHAHFYEVVNQLDNDPYSYTFGQLIEQEIEIQETQLAPVAVNGTTYSYAYTFVGTVSPRTTGIKVYVDANDNYDVYGYSDQRYGIDYLAPVVWATSPVGDVINPDAVPPTYESASLEYGTDVAISVAYNDIPGFTVLETGNWWYDYDNFYSDAEYVMYENHFVYYTGASAIDASGVKVYLNGVEIENGVASNGGFVANAGVLPAGNYTVTADVPDRAGNVGHMSYNFVITGGAPTITFNPVNGNSWWVNSINQNVFTFTVDSDNILAGGSVVANIYTVPSNNLLQGPITPALNNNIYSLTLQGGIIPAGQTGVRLEVTVTDVWGGQSVSNQVYGIDNNAPVVSISSPVADAQIVMNNTVNIMATINDNIDPSAKLSRNAGFTTSSTLSTLSDRAGSGIGSVQLRVVGPNGTNVYENTYPANTQVLAQAITASAYGTHTVYVTAIDNALNQNLASVTYEVVPANAPTVTFNTINAGAWWLNNVGNNLLTFTVETPIPATVSAKLTANPAGTVIAGPMNVNPSNGVYTVALHSSMIPQEATSVTLEITAVNTADQTGVYAQIYNIDRTAPVVTFDSPLADAQYVINSNVNIAAVITDMLAQRTSVENTISKLDAATSSSKAPGSGIASANLKVIAPNGATLVNQAFPANTMEIEQSVVASAYGTYTVTVTALDNAQNQSVSSVNFVAIPAAAPVITFNEINNNGWWLVNNNTNTLTFGVSSVLNTTVATVLTAVPSGIEIPVTATFNGTLYTVALNGSVIPENTSSVELKVTATDVMGLVSVNSQNYSVDKMAPSVSVFSPANGTEVVLVNSDVIVNVYAQFSDLNNALKGRMKSQFGSGIAGARLIMTNPNNVVSTLANTGANIEEIAATVNNLVTGVYTITLTVWDKAGNQATAQTQFNVVALPVVPEVLDITEAFIYPNPMTTVKGANFRVKLTTAANVKVRIYDFAGREVKVIDRYASKSEFVDIAWDGRNDSNVKLARGTYFARVIANDGKKIVEKVVKVAITE